MKTFRMKVRLGSGYGEFTQKALTIGNAYDILEADLISKGYDNVHLIDYWVTE